MKAAFKKSISRIESRLAGDNDSSTHGRRPPIPDLQRSDPVPTSSTNHRDSSTSKEETTNPLEQRSDDPPSTAITQTSASTSTIADLIPPVNPELMKKIGRFRILIIGRANSGKSTVLERICNSTKDPEIYNEGGEKVDLAIRGSTTRGHHDINLGIVFKSHPNFVFHDSPGFEAGCEDEFEQVKTFITNHTHTTTPPDKKIHMIWYCIPMSQFYRAVGIAEEKFFSEWDTGNVPVIVLFTWWDALMTQTFQLDDLSLPPEDQRTEWRKRAERTFDQRNIWGDLCKMRFPPRDHVRLENMNRPDGDYAPLLEKTATILKESLPALVQEDRDEGQIT